MTVGIGLIEKWSLGLLTLHLFFVDKHLDQVLLMNMIEALLE